MGMRSASEAPSKACLRVIFFVMLCSGLASVRGGVDGSSSAMSSQIAIVGMGSRSGPDSRFPTGNMVFFNYRYRIQTDFLAFSGPSDNRLAFVGFSMAKNILIVDDSRLARLLIKAVIDDVLPGSVITEADNASNALDLARDVKAFDISIIDFNMPGRTGLELYAALASVVDIEKKALLTANLQDAIRDEAESAGVTFLSKPIDEFLFRKFIEN
jgi:two-component system chemotaxis response regulator CheY